MTAGDGASFSFVDRGQAPAIDGGRQLCNDPPSQGGAFRAQDLAFPGDPVAYAGAVLRIDPLTGAALSDNPRSRRQCRDDRVIAFGLRNPFRLTVRPGTSEVWVGDVGWNTVEEINRVVYRSTRPSRTSAGRASKAPHAGQLPECGGMPSAVRRRAPGALLGDRSVLRVPSRPTPI